MSKIMSWNRLLALLCLPILVALIGSSSHQAQATHLTYPVLPVSDEAKCWPLDLILLIDQSYSMFSGEPSDPMDYRYKAAKEVLRSLIYNRRDECPEAIHRFSVISFGDRAVVNLPLLEIDISSGDNVEFWSAPYRNEIDKAALDRTQQYTDPKKAFEYAERMLNEARVLDDPKEYGLRRQVVIILTDGNPTSLSQPRGFLSEYMCELSEYLLGPGWSNPHIWFVGLKYGSTSYLNQTGCEDKTIRDNWEEIVSQHNGQLLDLPYNEQNIPAVLTTIINAEFGHAGESIQCGEKFYIDPYIKELKLQFFRREDYQGSDLLVTIDKLDDSGNNPTYSIKGETESGDPFEMNLKRYEVTGDGSETFVFERPLPGAWKFEVTDLATSECQKRISATATSLDAHVQMLQPGNALLAMYDKSPYSDPNQPTYFMMQLNADEGIPLSQSTNYPLDVEVIWRPPSQSDTLPDGTPILPIQLFWEAEGRWSSRDPVLTPEVGTYSLNVIGRARKGNPELGEFEVFNKKLSYEVRELTPFSFSIESPRQDDLLACNTVQEKKVFGNPVNIRLYLIDAAGMPTDARQFINSDLNQVFGVSLTDANGALLGEVNLAPNPTSPGLFEGTLLSGIDEVVGCGLNKLVISFQGHFDPVRFFLQKDQEEITFSRLKTLGPLVEILNRPETANQLHPGFCVSEVQPAQIEIKLVDLEGNWLDPGSIADSQATDLYKFRLVSPDPKLWEDLTPTIETRAEGKTFVATGGASLDLPGEYYFEITPNASAFKAGYLPADSVPIKITFSRDDTWMTKPSTCNSVKGAGMALLALLVVSMVIASTGGPGGYVELVDAGNPNNILVTRRLSKARILSTISGKDLEKFSIKSIKAKKAKTLSENKRAANLTVLDTDNQPLLADSYVEEEDINPLTPDINIIFR
jgi:hypothetical protein